MMALLRAGPPSSEQYLTFLANLIRGDFGYSLKYVGQSVNDIIAQTFRCRHSWGCRPICSASHWDLSASLPPGGGPSPDYTLVGFSVLGVSVPVFILASLLQYVFATKLGWFPVAQWKGFAYTILPILTFGHRLHCRENPQYAHA